MELYLNKERLAFFSSPTVFNNNCAEAVEVISQYDITQGVIILANGTNEEHIPLGKTFTIPESLLTAGRITGTVKLMCGQTIVKKWDISPLVVIEHDDGIKSYDALVVRIQELEARIARLEENSEIIV